MGGSWIVGGDESGSGVHGPPLFFVLPFFSLMGLDCLEAGASARALRDMGEGDQAVQRRRPGLEIMRWS